MQVSVSHTDKFDLRIYTHMLETQETRVQSLGQENPMEEKMTTTPVFLPGKFHKVVRKHEIVAQERRLHWKIKIWKSPGCR